MKAKIFRNREAARKFLLDNPGIGWSGNNVDIVRQHGARRWIVREWAEHGRSAFSGADRPFDWFVLSDDAGKVLHMTTAECDALMAGGPGPCPYRHDDGFLCGMPAAVGGWVCVYDANKASFGDPNEPFRWILMHPETGGLTYIHSREYAIYTQRQVAEIPNVAAANGICEIFAFDTGERE